MTVDISTKCVECIKTGLLNDPNKLDAHCLECMHCEDHCDASYSLCYCCCEEEHCYDCEHNNEDECDLTVCNCCCNTHCLTCGHNSYTICSVEDTCICCCKASAVNYKLDISKANPDKDALKILKKLHLTLDYESVLGPKEILKDIGLFYILIAHGDADLLTKHKEMLAKRILNYLLVSCAGEARHTLSKTHGDIEKLSTIAQTLVVGWGTSSNLSNRKYMWSAAYDLAQEIGYTPILSALVELFGLEWTTVSYGGAKWQKIAQLAYNYSSGDYTDAIFIDGIMNIVHNGGWAFNKYYVNSAGGDYYNPGIGMNSLLDFKKEANTTNIYALLVPLAINQTKYKILWDTAREKKVIEAGVDSLTLQYKNIFPAETSSSGYYTPTMVEVPSQAYIDWLKLEQETVKSYKVK